MVADPAVLFLIALAVAAGLVTVGVVLVAGLGCGLVVAGLVVAGWAWVALTSDGTA